MYRTFHLKVKECTFFSSAHGSFFRVDHLLGHKRRLSPFKKTENISGSFSDHSGMKLDINYEKKTGKSTNRWRLNDMLLNNQWVKEKSKEILKNAL